MGVLWFKILRDLWDHKARTAQVVLIIGIGAAAIGMIMGTRTMMVSGMQQIWLAGRPAMINLYVGPPITEDEVVVLRRVEGVAQIEGLCNTTVEWRVSPEDEWKAGGLNARVDYLHQQLNLLELVSGGWPDRKVMLVEQGSDSAFGIPLDGQVYLRVNDRDVQVQIGGDLYNPLSQPASMGGTAQFYTTLVYYQRLVGNSDFSQLMVTAPRWDEPAVTDLADRLQAKLEDQGKQSGRRISNPNKHFFQDNIDLVFVLLGVLAAISLVLGLLLVYNTMNALIARQVNQIGILKAVGAQTGQILALFLIAVSIYGLLAMLLAVPVGILGAWNTYAWLVANFGADPGPFQFSPQSVVAMILITLLAPLAASLIPIFSVARITVRESITTYGLSTKAGLIERLGARLRFLSRMFLLTISNTFHNKWRVALMQIALVISGMTFMMVVSARDSVVHTYNDILSRTLDADITFILDGEYRIDYAANIALAYPRVRAVESWARRNVTIRPAGRPYSEDDEASDLYGLPLPTGMYGYQLRQGRWLEPTDSHAIVLNQRLAEDVGVGVGDWVTVRYAEDQEHDWRVVGLIFDPVMISASSAPRDVLLRDLNQVGRTSTLWIDTTGQSPAAQIAIATELRQYFNENGIEISPQRGVFGIGDATVEVVQTAIGVVNFVIVLLAMMAVIIGAVGSIALSGTISLSVMERTREIGVMRAIGASSWAIARLFIGEGLILGWLSWLIALPLSLPVGRIMVVTMGQAMGSEFVYHYTPTGALLWLAIITVLSVLASWFPARNAMRISVRQSLAYQ